LFAGYRFPKRLAEIRLGLLNLTDEDESVSDLFAQTQPLRGRALAVRVKLSF
jgi:hypothetical protein